MEKEHCAIKEHEAAMNLGANQDNSASNQDNSASNQGFLTPKLVNIDIIDQQQNTEQPRQVQDDELDFSKLNLEGETFESEADAYEVFNDYAYRMGFSVRKSKTRKRAKSENISMRQFCCWKEGYKAEPEKDDQAYERMNVRCGCKARIKFSVGKDGTYTCNEHIIKHNHPLVLPSQRHKMPSHRTMSANQLYYVRTLVRSGIRHADAVRALKREAGGSPFLSFTLKDAYNKLAEICKVEIDGDDANALIQIFRGMQAKDSTFFFDFQTDKFGRLVNFFWRDKKMLEAYLRFGDVVIHDTTFKTNMYAMICAPFVGMNNHGQNVMFGCALMINQSTESFKWLFQTFLRSMEGKQPQTFMTDQAFSMACAMREVFPNVTHRLCLWHIMENSKKNINHLRCKEGFVTMFNRILKECDSKEEFQHYWDKMIAAYECGDNVWLRKLYHTKEHWCPVFSKHSFSGGILSTQRSESTNSSVSRRVHSTASLCDFYEIFMDIVEEWRSNENGENYQCAKGTIPMDFKNVGILKCAESHYTIWMFKIFQKEFKKCNGMHQQLIEMETSHVTYKVWHPEDPRWSHIVVCGTSTITCTCGKYTEVGILCCRILRVMHITCCQEIPAEYISERWCKDKSTEKDNHDGRQGMEDSSNESVWRALMMRKMNSLIFTAHTNGIARDIMEELFIVGKQEVEKEVGSMVIYVDEEIRHGNDTREEHDNGNENAKETEQAPKIKNPPTKQKTGERNTRKKSTVEKEYNKAHGRKKRLKTLELKKSAAKPAPTTTTYNQTTDAYIPVFDQEPQETTFSAPTTARSASSNNKNTDVYIPIFDPEPQQTTCTNMEWYKARIFNMDW